MWFARMAEARNVSSGYDGSDLVRITTNTSPYYTWALRRIVVQAHAYIRRFEGDNAPQWDDLEIVIRGRHKRKYMTGCAVVGGKAMRLTLPDGLTARRLLWLSYHELMHCFGYRHRQFKNIPAAELEQLIPSDYEIALKQKNAANPIADVKTARVVKLLRRERLWKARLSPAKNETAEPALVAATSDRGIRQKQRKHRRSS